MTSKHVHEKRTWAVLFFFTLMTISNTGCYYDKEELLYPASTGNCSTLNATFTSVKIIIAGKCATSGCHNAASAAGNAVLETYDQIKAKAGRINQRAVVEKTMPPAAPLSASETAILQCWISSGTPNN